MFSGADHMHRMAIMSLMLQQHGIDSIRYDELTTSPQQLAPTLVQMGPSWCCYIALL